MTESKVKVLIVEDDLSSQIYYTHLLEDQYDLHLVTNVADAKTALKQHEYSVAIVDISLPGDESGIDLIKFIQDKYPKNPDCIALTAHAFPHIKVEALEAGADEFFTKPIMSETLIESIEKHLTQMVQG